MSATTPAAQLEEGMEILLRASTGETQIVEDVRPAPWRGPHTAGRVTVTLIDGRSLTVAGTHPVTVYS